MVFANHGHRSRVLGAVTAAASTVVVRGIRIEASAGVIRIAFASFFFGFRFFSSCPFGFFGSCLFASSLFCFFGSKLPNFSAVMTTR